MRFVCSSEFCGSRFGRAVFTRSDLNRPRPARPTPGACIWRATALRAGSVPGGALQGMDRGARQSYHQSSLHGLMVRALPADILVESRVETVIAKAGKESGRGWGESGEDE